MSFELDEAIIAACGTAFYFRSQVRALFLKAGVPPAMYDRYGDQSKFQTARGVIGELDTLGERGRQVKRKLVMELAGLREPMENASNPAEGRANLKRLRELAQAGRVVVDVKTARCCSQAPGTQGARQTEDCPPDRRVAHPLQGAGGQQSVSPAAGARLRAAVRRAFRAARCRVPQVLQDRRGAIDGAVYYKGFDYLVESKWEKAPTGVNDLFTFLGKVTGKAESTRGLFIAQAAFRPEVVQQLAQASKRLIQMDGSDLALVFEGVYTLTDVLDIKTAKAAQEGLVFYPMVTHRR